LFLLVACTASTVEGDGGLKLTPGATHAPPTRARWQADPLERSRVEVADDAGAWLATDWAAAGTGTAEATVLGPWAGGSFTARVVLENGEAGDPVDLIPAPLPADFPTLTLTGEAPGVGWTLLSVLSTGPSYAALLDDAGHVAAFHPLSGNAIAGGARTRPRRDGQGIWWASLDESPAVLHGVSWMGEPLSATRVNGLNHDYSELADGSFVWIGQECRTTEEGARVCGNTLVAGEPGGDADVRFNSWDRFDPAVDGPWDPDDPNWTHANALVVDEAAGTAWFGLRNLDTLLRIDLATGAVLDQIGGAQATLAADAGAGLDHQHRLAVVDDATLLVHDNRTAALGSRIARLTLNRAAGTVHGEDAWVHDPPLWDYVLGDVDARADGTVRVTWSTGGAVDELAADGTLRATLTAPLGTVFGYSTTLPELPGMVPLR